MRGTSFRPELSQVPLRFLLYFLMLLLLLLLNRAAF